MNQKTTHNCSILAIGNELISGSTQDTNSSFVARSLEQIGVRVKNITQVGDSLEEITTALARLCKESDLIITSGGLGPTSDDLTREAIAAAAGVSLIENELSKTKLLDWAKKRNRTISPNNLKQALFPAGSRRIENQWGTADSFVTELKVSEKIVPVFTLPGVPRELTNLITAEVIPSIEKTFKLPPKDPVIPFRCFGVSEAKLGNIIDSLALPEHIEVAYRPQFPEILITLTNRGLGQIAEREAELCLLRTKIGAAIGEHFIFSNSKDCSLPETLSHLLVAQNKTLATAESCSGGLIGHKLVSIPGASKFYLGGMISYSNEAKQILLGIKGAILEKHGAVSAEVAKDMANNARLRLGADIGVGLNDGGRAISAARS